MFTRILDVILVPGLRAISGDGQWLVDDAGRQLARVVGDGDVGQLRADVDALGGAAAHAVVRYLVGWAHGHYRYGGARGNLPPIEQGIAGLTRYLLLRGGGARTEVRKVVSLLARIAPTWPDQTVKPILDLYELHPPGRKKPAQLRVQACGALEPQFLTDRVEDGRSVLAGRDVYRPAVPLRLPRAPRPNERAAASALELMLVLRLRDVAADLPATGGLTIFSDELDELTATLGVGTDAIEGILRLWQKTPIERATVAVLEVERHRLRVGLGGSLEAAFMKDGGEESVQARRRQTFGEAAKRAKRRSET